MAATMKIVINTPGLRIHHQHPRHPRLMALSYSSGSKGRVKQQSSQQEFLAPEAPKVISSQVGSLARHAFVETRGIAFVATLDDRPEPQLLRHAQRGAVLKVNKTNGPHGAEPIFHPLQRCSGSFGCITPPLRRRRDRPARFRRLVETSAELPAEIGETGFAHEAAARFLLDREEPIAGDRPLAVEVLKLRFPTTKAAFPLNRHSGRILKPADLNHKPHQGSLP